MIYVRRAHPVSAVRYDGTNRADVAALLDAACVLYEMPDNPALSVMARHIPVMGADGRWLYLGEGDWLVIRERDQLAEVWSNDSFNAAYRLIDSDYP